MYYTSKYEEIKLYLQCIRLYCFRGLKRNLVFVVEKVFSITVASTVTNSRLRIGRPTRLKSVPPTNITFSSFRLSPGFGGQYPWITMISFSVTLNCFPQMWTTAKRRLVLPLLICSLIFAVISVQFSIKNYYYHWTHFSLKFLYLNKKNDFYKKFLHPKFV